MFTPLASMTFRSVFSYFRLTDGQISRQMGKYPGPVKEYNHWWPDLHTMAASRLIRISNSRIMCFGPRRITTKAFSCLCIFRNSPRWHYTKRYDKKFYFDKFFFSILDKKYFDRSVQFLEACFCTLSRWHHHIRVKCLEGLVVYFSPFYWRFGSGAPDPYKHTNLKLVFHVLKVWT